MSMKREMISEKSEIMFLMPGLLEVMTLRGGGREERIFQIAERLSKHYCISLVAPFLDVYHVRKRLKNKLVLENIYCPAMKHYPPKSQMARILAILALIWYIMGSILKTIHHRRTGMKLVIVSDITSGILPSIVAHFMGIKVIWYEGNLYPWIRNERNTSVGSMIIRGIQVTLAQLLGSITRVTIVNDGIIENALELSSIKSKIAVVRAGVNTSSFKPKDPLSNYHKFRIAFIGRLSDEKGACQLLHVCKYAEQHFPEVEFFILGDGPYKTKLQKLLNIRYIGSVEHDLMSEMLSTVDGVMTFQMTFGLGEVEALACGKPIIGSRIGEMPELISRKLGPIGLVCENSTLSYIESIRYLMEHKELLLQLSKNARQIATSEFDWDIITKKWKDVIVDA